MVTLIEVLEHIPDDDLSAFVRNVARLLKDNGRLLVSVPTVDVPVNRKHYRHYDLDLLRATLQPHFAIESTWWLYRRGLVERCIRSLMCNRLYILNSGYVSARLWAIHKRLTYRATARTGVHLICLAKPNVQTAEQ